MTLLLPLVLAACGGDESRDLLVAADLKPVYEGAAGSVFGITNSDPGSFGTIRGRVVYPGDRRARPIDIPSSQAYCQQSHPSGLSAEDFRVGPEGGLEGAVVYVRKGANAGRRVSWETPTEAAVLDQQGCQYVPHVLLLRTGQPLLIKSSDETLHNVKSLDSVNPGFNQAMPGPGTLPPKTFSKEEVAKFILCDVHTWMGAYVAILSHPLAAVTDAQGNFEITGVPPGKYIVTVWHEKLGTKDAGDAQSPFEVAASEDKTITFTYEG